MEAAEPIQLITPKTIIDSQKVDFIEELTIKKEKDEYKIQFGESQNNLVIKVVNQSTKDLCYYQKEFSLNELQKLSIVFYPYKTLSNIIPFLINLKYEIEENKDDLNIKFDVFSLDGKSKLIELNLKKYLLDNNHIINYLLEEIKELKLNTQKLEKNFIAEKSKNESEQKALSQNIFNNKFEISQLKEENRKLWEENNKLWNENNKLKMTLQNFNSNEKQMSTNNLTIFTIKSKIIQSLNSIDFILNYIRKNDEFLKFNNIKLLYRGSRDGDRTKTCHELCDNKTRVIIIIQSDTNYIFGGYSKIGFKTDDKVYKIDNHCFLFSLNLHKIYPVIKDKPVICHIKDTFGLCFYESIGFYDNFMSITINKILSKIKTVFNGIGNEYEMNGGNQFFRIKELEVFQIL